MAFLGRSAQELQELLVSMTWVTGADHGAVEHVERREQTGAARQTRGLLRRIALALKGRRLAEELIAERRAEAARE